MKQKKSWPDHVVEFFHLSKKLMLEFVVFVSGLMYAINCIQEHAHHFSFISIALFVVLFILLISSIFFKILPSIRKGRELELRPSGEDNTSYFTTSPIVEDKYKLYAKGYQQYVDWVVSPKSTILFLTGRSGSGKSSMLNALIIPELKKNIAINTIIRQYKSSIAIFEDIYFDFTTQHQFQSGVNTITADLLLNEILDYSSKLTDKDRLFIILDQFEEIFLQTDGGEKDNKILELKAFLKLFIDAAPKHVYILFSYREDYQNLVDDLELPARNENTNFRSLRFLKKTKAVNFLKNCPGLKIPQARMDLLIKEAEQIDDKDSIRPIVLNLLGIVSAKMNSDEVLLKRRNNLIKEYLSTCLRGELNVEKTKIIKTLLTDFDTVRRMTVEEISGLTKFPTSTIDTVLLNLRSDGIVRLVNEFEASPVKRSWQISHDFIAQELSKVINSPMQDFFQKHRHTIIHSVNFLVIFSFLLLSWKGNSIEKDNAIKKINTYGLKWDDKTKTVSAYVANILPFNDTVFHEIVKNISIIRPDSFILWFPVPSQLSNSYDYSLLLNNTNLSELGNLSSLKGLTIANNTYIQNLDFIRGLTNLTSLRLYACLNLKKIDAVNDLRLLEDLDLRYTSYAFQDIDPIKTLTKLTTLHLSSCPVVQNKEAISVIASLVSIKNLDISISGFNDIGSLLKLTSLEKIDLHGCFDLNDVRRLETLKTLKVIDLRNCNKLTYNQIQDLQLIFGEKVTVLSNHRL